MSVVAGKSKSGATRGTLIQKVKVKGHGKPVANSRFNFLINCNHDLKNAYGCPMCKLVHMVTRKHFDDEREQNRLAHEQSLVNRAQLRLTLMLRWARTQSVLYNKYVSAPTFDIVFSKALASILVDEDAIMSREQPIDFDEVVKVLERRNRITEVGHFAAIFLQSRIRKYLAKRYVRRMMLQRFEYVPATRWKEAFYIDTYWSRKKERTPRFLRNELPATPRTIGRRLAADERHRNARYEAFKKDVIKRYQALEGADVWAKEETTVRFLKQMGVLRDLVRIAMLNITKMRLQRDAAAEKLAQEARQAVASTPNAQGLNRRGSVSNRINLQRQAEEAAAAASAMAAAENPEESDVPVEIQPVWMCLSAPCMSSRELGLALALATVPSPASGQLLVRKHPEYGPRFSPAAAPTTTGGMAEYIPPAPGGGGGRERSISFGVNSMPGSPGTLGVGRFVKTGTAASMLSMGSTLSPVTTARTSSSPKPVRRESTAGSSVTSTAQLHRALNFLETSLWQCLRCATPEEVLSKLLVEDLRPSFVSVMNITQEEKNIWRGKMGHIPSTKAATKRDERRHSRGGYSDDSSLGSEDRSDNSSESEKEETEVDEFAHEVLPLSLQLRPYFPERGCNGFFRLFFYMDELIVASSVSPWAFYPEVLKNRDLINNSIRAYATLPSTRSFLQQYLTRANIHSTGQDMTGLVPGDLQPIAALTRSLTSAGVGAGVKGGASGKNIPQRRPSVSLNRENTANGRRKSLVPPAVNTSGIAAAERGPELTHLFVPPEELIYHGTAPDRSAYNRMRDISQFSDDKAMQMSKKYTFMNKNSAFVERLKRAEHNAASRLKRRGATTATATAQTAAPSKAFMENSPFHQRRARLEEWFASDAHIPAAALYRGGPLGDEVNAALLKDIHSVHGDLLGGKIMRLLLGPEAGDPAEDTVNVFDGTHQAHGHARHLPSIQSAAQSRSASVDTRTSSIASAGTAGVHGGLPGITVGSSAEERELPEYEAKLHRYSSKARVEIMERLRRPADVPRVKELFPMVVMDVYVQLPGKAGLATPGTPGGNMRRGFSAASGVTAGSGSASEGQGPNTPTNTLNREGTSSSLNGGPPGAGLLAVDLQQIVGAFTCDGDRPPPNLDCGLVQWEHFYHLHRSRVSSMFPASLNSFNEGSSNNSVSSASSKGSNSASSANQRSNYWTPPSSETGISTYLSNMPSGLQYQFHMLANPPSKQHLERTLPKKVKEWVGLPV